MSDNPFQKYAPRTTVTPGDENPFSKYAPKAAAAEEGTLSKVARAADGYVRQIADGVTFGLADKVAAKLDEMTGRGGSYDDNLKTERARTETFAEENPISATAAQIAGGIVTGGGLAKAGVTLLPRVAGKGMAAKIGAGAAEGAAYGAVTGAGHTDGQASDYVDGAAEGAKYGALIGGALPIAGKAIGKAYETVEPLVRGQARDLPRGAGGVLASATSADRAGLDAVKQLGPDAMLADAGPSFLGIAQGVATRPGEGRSALVNAVTERNQGRTGRLAADTAENLGPARSPIEATQELAATRAAKTNPAITKALAEAGPVDVSEVVGLIEKRMPRAEGAEKAALQRVLGFLVEAPAVPAQTGTRVPIMSPDGARVIRYEMQGATPGSPARLQSVAENLNNAKGEIDRLIKYGDPTLGVTGGSLAREQGALKQARGALNFALRKQVPGYADAMDGSAGYARQMEAIERGTDVLAGGKTAVWPSDLAKTMAAMSPEEQAALKLGARADVENRVGTQANDLAALKKAVGGEGDWNREKMAQVFGPEPTERMIGAVEREQTFANTYADVARGSQTGARQGGAAAIDEAAVSIPKNATVAGLAGHIGERLARAAFQGIVGLKSQTDRAELGRLLSAQGPERDQIIESLLSSADTRAAIGKAMDQAVRHPALLRALAIENGNRSKSQ